MANSSRISLAGEFAVLSQLALRGYDANMTLGNTKGVDILVSEPETGGMFRLEVKTSMRRPSRSNLWGHTYGWVMSEKHEGIVDPLLTYCFVNMSENMTRYFVVPCEMVADYVETEHRFWLAGDSSRRHTTMRTFRIGLDVDGYPIPTPLSSEHEDAWSRLH